MLTLWMVGNSDNFKNIGDGHTIADQINEVFEPYELAVIPASNDRIGGWHLMYQMLQKGEWQIADTCPKLIEAIPTRMHDEKRPGDVLKVRVTHWMTWPTMRAMESTLSSRLLRSHQNWQSQTPAVN